MGAVSAVRLGAKVGLGMGESSLARSSSHSGRCRLAAWPRASASRRCGDPTDQMRRTRPIQRRCPMVLALFFNNLLLGRGVSAVFTARQLFGSELLVLHAPPGPMPLPRLGAHSNARRTPCPSHVSFAPSTLPRQTGQRSNPAVRMNP